MTCHETRAPVELVAVAGRVAAPTGAFGPGLHRRADLGDSWDGAVVPVSPVSVVVTQAR